MTAIRTLASVLGALLLGFGVLAQTLPAPSRMVYKCELQGKVVYSDEPCPAAKRVDVTPTRGLDSSSGRPRLGADVRRERENEVMSGALRPILNESPEQRAKRHKRLALSEEVKKECQALDARLPALEAEEKSSSAESRAQAQQALLAARTRFRELRC